MGHLLTELAGHQPRAGLFEAGRGQKPDKAKQKEDTFVCCLLSYI